MLAKRDGFLAEDGSGHFLLLPHSDPFFPRKKFRSLLTRTRQEILNNLFICIGSGAKCQDRAAQSVFCPNWPLFKTGKTPKSCARRSLASHVCTVYFRSTPHRAALFQQLAIPTNQMKWCERFNFCQNSPLLFTFQTKSSSYLT